MTLISQANSVRLLHSATAIADGGLDNPTALTRYRNDCGLTA
ncbi:hypothetical protein [Dickeya lacustris]|uniref:Uncharacterized protein n=1 Tax=Dickeya lacustris TaxID=2259638 RepID=A0ABY8G8E8_9GAMM|nr:hypothetical protein [Dickeya lacustris]WFN56236.1 hypothetical protein O1Q98_02690 [Dickeya lacustris]